MPKEKTYNKEEQIILKKLGKIIRYKRKILKLKFTIFCYENDISPTTLYMIETGKTNAGILNYIKIIKSMGLDYEEFGKMLKESISDTNYN